MMPIERSHARLQLDLLRIGNHQKCGWRQHARNDLILISFVRSRLLQQKFGLANPARNVFADATGDCLLCRVNLPLAQQMDIW